MLHERSAEREPAVRQLGEKLYGKRGTEVSHG